VISRSVFDRIGTDTPLEHFLAWYRVHERLPRPIRARAARIELGMSELTYAAALNAAIDSHLSLEFDRELVVRLRKEREELREARHHTEALT
jgi:hypothetical protein